uniref:Negative elongation factor E n=1 Tax=Arion vulgaris TaxID=1028688 RepID=A0A0B6ZTN5_9EUPU
MVFIHFPAALTEEEEILKQTLAKLKKKKKQVQSLKAAANNQEKETTHNKSANKPAPTPSMNSADKATEQAKKLVQSGAIKVTSQKEKFGFKRSNTFEKKKDTEKPAAPLGFQPFMSFTGEGEEDKQPPSKRVKGLSESFVSAGYGNRSYDKPEREHREPPKKGNTLYVNGIGINEDLIRKSFSNFGKIVNINMETDKNTAFVTFEQMEAADQAIAEINGSMVNNIQLCVQLARRQPMLDNLGENLSAAPWSSIAASNSQKGSAHVDPRDMLSYDGDIF